MDELPREKIIRIGSSYLETRELISVLLNNGSRHESVFEMAARIDRNYINDLASFKTVEQIVEQLKLPLIKASQLCACIEIGRRIFDKTEEIFINSSRKIYENFKHLSNFKIPEFYLCILDKYNKILSKQLIFLGANIKNYNSKDIFKKVLEINCEKFFIVCGGEVELNKNYIDFSIDLKKKADILEIIFIDFVIVKDHSYISFKEKTII